jgi:hypothetical protein
VLVVVDLVRHLFVVLELLVFEQHESERSEKTVLYEQRVVGQEVTAHVAGRFETEQLGDFEFVELSFADHWLTVKPAAGMELVEPLDTMSAVEATVEEFDRSGKKIGHQELVRLERNEFLMQILREKFLIWTQDSTLASTGSLP